MNAIEQLEKEAEKCQEEICKRLLGGGLAEVVLLAAERDAFKKAAVIVKASEEATQ